MPNLLLRIHPQDNVAVVLEHLEAGQTLDLFGNSVTLPASIKRGHKVALTPIQAGKDVIKYGHRIGRATVVIQPGDWVHTHNLMTHLHGTLEYIYTPEKPSLARFMDELTFDGFLRSHGEAGIRNEIWILPTVGCINPLAEALAREFNQRLPLGSLSGVYAFPHPYGCSQLGQDHENTRRLLAALALHPNAGGVLVIGLGCENNTLAAFQPLLGEIDATRFRFMVAQEVNDEMEHGRRLLEDLAASVSQLRRQPVPVSSLRVGLKCGGSDAFSGITANPLVGRFSDLLVAHGGATILTEVPEMFGAEGLLMNRCANREVFNRCARMINGFKEYFLRHNQVVYENPSPGNKEGGISTLEEKSLGCTQKGGSSPVVDVLDYGDRLRKPGLNLLNGPGNDIVSLTALAAAGAQLLLFTTGRGTPLGGPVPTLKISSQTELASRKQNWIDFNAGSLLDGASLEDLAGQLFYQVLDVASGRTRTLSEIHGYREIAIFKDGVTL